MLRTIFQSIFHRRIPAPRRLLMLAAAAVAALALSACGGGGGGSTSGSGAVGAASRAFLHTKAAPEVKTAAAAAQVHQRQQTFLRGRTFEAARQTYEFLVTHQASVSPATLQSQAPATLFVERNSKGPIDYIVTYTNSNAYQSVYLNTTAGDDTWNQASAIHGSATYSADSDTDVSLSTVELSTTSKDGTRIAYATVFTDYDVDADDTDDSKEDNLNTPEDESIANGTGDDTDYMAAGVWISGPASQANSDFPAFAGAFAMGKVPYTGLATGHDALTSVSYKGLAGGKRFNGGTVTDFTTTVSLTANFSSTATISGTVADVGGGQQLKLQSASIDRANDGGPFTGNTQLLDSDGNQVTGFAGKWGGAFYGATDATKGPPGTAGTFGVTGGDPSDTVLGAFIAHRQE